jgi:ABC-type transport system involved in multi-copper enzyme maturation permease subunit
MTRIWVILRHTFFEAIVAPIYSLLLAIGAGIIVIFGLLPFFTLGEDTVMFKSVAADVILLFVLIATLFATSKSIYEEIEDRTMLTLMSKPISRMEVLVGKYLGIICSALLAIAILGVILMLAVWWRIPTDYQIRGADLNELEAARLHNLRMMHNMGLIPQLLLMWMQISVLASVGVAISTRVSLVVNLPVVILLYIAGNLTRFLFPLSEGPLKDWPAPVKWLAGLVTLLLPYLRTFDLRDKTIYSQIAIGNMDVSEVFNAVTLGEIWRYVGVAGLNAVAYATFALAVGLLLFSSRDLGGAEG